MDDRIFREMVFTEHYLKELIDPRGELLVKNLSKGVWKIDYHTYKGLFHEFTIDINRGLSYDNHLTSLNRNQGFGLKAVEVNEEISKRVGVDIVLICANANKGWWSRRGYDVMSEELKDDLGKRIEGIELKESSAYKRIELRSPRIMQPSYGIGNPNLMKWSFI